MKCHSTFRLRRMFMIFEIRQQSGQQADQGQEGTHLDHKQNARGVGEFSQGCRAVAGDAKGQAKKQAGDRVLAGGGLSGLLPDPGDFAGYKPLIGIAASTCHQSGLARSAIMVPPPAQQPSLVCHPVPHAHRLRVLPPAERLRQRTDEVRRHQSGFRFPPVAIHRRARA